jgi:hypothetical protein
LNGGGGSLQFTTYAPGKPPEGELDGGEGDEGLQGRGEVLEVFGKTSIPSEPGKGTLHHLAARQDDQALHVDFMLAEMRNTENPKEMRLELARWVAPYCSPRLASISVVKSIHEMSRGELEWAIADAERGPVAAAAGHTAWRPRR